MTKNKAYAKVMEAVLRDVYQERIKDKDINALSFNEEEFVEYGLRKYQEVIKKLKPEDLTPIEDVDEHNTEHGVSYNVYQKAGKMYVDLDNPLSNDGKE